MNTAPPRPPPCVLLRGAPLLVALFSLAACKSGDSAVAGPEPESPPSAEPAEGPSAASPPTEAPASPAGAKTESFGGAFTEGTEVTLASLVSSPEEYAGKAVITEGKVQRACERKGCWMEIADGDAKCRVTFKDYGFFVPTDSAGASTRLQGELATRTVSAGRVKHLEAEGAHFPSKNADGSAQEVRLIATAVQITR